MKTAKIIPTSTLMVAALGLALGLAAAPALANPADSEGCHDHKTCVPDDPAPSGGGKAFLFEINNMDVLKCDGATDTTGASYGQVTWAGNVLWSPTFIHVHNKLQLKDVDPLEYQIFGNNDIVCIDGSVDVDVPLCGGDDLCPPMVITVKQNQQGRTSGALRLPGHNPDEPTTVWVTVTVLINGSMKILRSTPVTVVLPPNEVGTE